VGYEACPQKKKKKDLAFTTFRSISQHKIMCSPKNNEKCLHYLYEELLHTNWARQLSSGLLVYLTPFPPIPALQGPGRVRYVPSVPFSQKPCPSLFRKRAVFQHVSLRV